jgi:hypothetical protein
MRTVPIDMHKRFPRIQTGIVRKRLNYMVLGVWAGCLGVSCGIWFGFIYVVCRVVWAMSK